MDFTPECFLFPSADELMLSIILRIAEVIQVIILCLSYVDLLHYKSPCFYKGFL